MTNRPTLTLDLTADLNTIAAQAEEIAQRVLRDGDAPGLTFDPVGAETDDINHLHAALGGARLLLRSNRTDEVAVYVLDDGTWRICADANGSVAIRATR